MLPHGATIGPPSLLPTAEASRPPVKITEADKVAWMRQFLTSLEQWKGCVDALLEAEDDPSKFADPLLPDPPPAQDPALADPQLAAQAQQAAIWQQLQLLQQAQISSLADVAPTLAAAAPVVTPDPAGPLFQLAAAVGGQPRADSQLTEMLQQPTWAGMGEFPDLRLKKKKELCGRFARGHCTLGKVCAFAHGEEELDTVGLAVVGKVKTELCRNFEAGRCDKGINCNNAHGEVEIGTRRPPPELSQPPPKRPVLTVDVKGGKVAGTE